MLKLTINNNAKCIIDIKATPKDAIAEAIMASIHLSKVISQNMGVSFESAAMFLFQQATLAYKQTMDSMDGDTNG